MTVVVLGAAFGLVPLAAPAGADITTVSSDIQRDGWDQSESKLDPASVEASDFGQLFSASLDGQVYAQPLAVDGLEIVATENDHIYGIDANGTVKWNRSVGTPWPSSTIQCGDLTPNIGITSTPVYDPATDSVYFTSKVDDGKKADGAADHTNPHYYMHAVNPATGAERSGWPVVIAGTPDNDSTDVSAFHAESELQRPGLLLMGGVVYAAFGSHCDFGDYRGYVAGVSTTMHTMTSLWATETGGSDQGSGIWHAGGGIASTGWSSSTGGDMFVSTGNGVTAPFSSGSNPPSTLSESVVKLHVDPQTKKITTADFFSPNNAEVLDADDTDLASGGPVLLPSAFGTSQYPHVLFEQGKDGRVFLLNADDLGGRTSDNSGALAVLGPYEGLWGHAAAWNGGGGYLYTVGNGGPLRAFKAGSVNGKPTLSVAGASTESYGYTSGSPVITSSGDDNGVVWVVYSTGPTGANAYLRAYSAVPDSSGRLTLLASYPIGTAVKFTVPATDGNRVYVGTRDGKLLAFGYPAKTLLTGSMLNFGDVSTGTTTEQDMTLTATQDITVQKLGVASPFALQNPPAVPFSMKAGDKLVLHVEFTPGLPGAVLGALSLTTGQGSVGFSLNGNGVHPGLAASPAALSFDDQPVGQSAVQNVAVTNTGTSDEVITGLGGLSGGPLSYTGLQVGQTIAAGQSAVVAVTYAPTAAGDHQGALTIGSTSGTMTLPVSGQAVTGSGHLAISPASVSFGKVPVGRHRTELFELTNTGNLPLRISLAKAPDSAFSTPRPLAEGTIIEPGATVHQRVVFAPTANGAQTDRYQINGADGQGSQRVSLTGTGITAPVGTTATTLTWPSKNVWSANGSAVVKKAKHAVWVTPEKKKKVGSYLTRTAVRTAGLRASFTAQFGPGHNGQGLAFVLLDPNRVKPTAVGKGNLGVGFRGLRGVGVVFGTTKNKNAGGSSNFVGLSVGPGGSALKFFVHKTLKKSLRSGTYKVSVNVVGGRIQVWVDGKKVLSHKPPAGSLPSTALVGWTAATGPGGSARHSIIRPWVSVRVPVKIGQPLTASPSSVGYNDTNIGKTAASTVVLTNNGGVAEKVTSVRKPPAPFAATLPAVGKVIQPGASISIPVSFAPTNENTSVGTFEVTTTSGSIVVPVHGTGTNELPDLQTSSWVASGTAGVWGSTVGLTGDGSKDAAGLLLNSMPVQPQGIEAEFITSIQGSQEAGGNGVTFSLIDAGGTKPTAPGASGEGLGVAGLTGIVIGFGTAPSGSITDDGGWVAVGRTAASDGTPEWIDHASLSGLRQATHVVDITIDSTGKLVVTVDGAKVLTSQLTNLPAKVWAAFTGSTGATLTDTNNVLNPRISYDNPDGSGG